MIKLFYKDKVILVTGGTGFVGIHLVQELIKNGAKVRITVNKRPLVIEDKNIETVKADLTKQDDCIKAVKGADFVFHAAGLVSGVGVKSNFMISGITANLVMTAQMLKSACDENIERFLIFSSSTGYPLTNYPVKEEEMWAGPMPPFYSGYGWMRRYFEKLSEFIASNSNMKIAIVRPTAVYGRWDNFDIMTSHFIPALVRKAVEKQNPYEVWGSGEDCRDCLHITDLARGCLLMLEKNANCDPVNIGYGRAYKIKEIVRIILKAAGHENANVVFNTSKPTAIPFRMVDVSKAKKILGFEPQTTLEEGLKDTVDWYARTRNLFPNIQ
ncbi:MAG: NAD-dependent epimerase/dehydratase family protein [Candidatus Methanoperedens sp.]|nr:NAD-dependent epimerase/dehydratase family protein [Candidatus Methanoperedens sp.]